MTISLFRSALHFSGYLLLFGLLENTLMQNCYFCSQNRKVIDYKDVETLQRFVSGQAKIIDPRYTNVCAKHQRRLAHAIKRARYMALLPFVRR